MVSDKHYLGTLALGKCTFIYGGGGAVINFTYSRKHWWAARIQDLMVWTCATPGLIHQHHRGTKSFIYDHCMVEHFFDPN